MPISPIVPLSSVTPTAVVPPVGLGDTEALALARATISRTTDILGVLVAQTTPSEFQSTVAASGAMGGDAHDVDSRPADALHPTALPKADPRESAERAVAAAADRAVQRQGGLAPLMADMAQAALEPATPPRVRHAIDQVMALVHPLSPDVTASDVRRALDHSGLFLEARLAAGLSPEPRSSTSRHAPPDRSNDLKAALLVFRQVVKVWTDVAPSASAGLGERERPGESWPGLRARPAPPPYAGAPTHAQPVAQPGLPPGADPSDVARRLLLGAGAALARTELLQLASRPEAVAIGRNAEEPSARWVFDMPFLTPQGPAVAQFEISRDGGGGEAGVREMGRTWRARFSLDVEPMGPIHAQISLTGDRARVSLWAERPDGMARLRGEQASLQVALREAALEPELVFHPGSPQGPVVEPGRFVDRAT